MLGWIKNLIKIEKFYVILFLINVWSILLMVTITIYNFTVVSCPIFYYYSICNFVLLNIVSLILIKYHKHLACYFFMYIDVFLFSTISCYLIGWSAGFSFLALSLIPISFSIILTFRKTEKVSIKLPVILSVINILTITVERYIVYTNGSFYTLGPDYNFILAIINNISCSVAIAAFEIMHLYEISKQNKLINFYATHDCLTELYNRAKLFESIKGIKNGCSCICDIDDFKMVNDTYGHPFGDEVLRTIGKILKEFLKPNEYACRWGGEEFVLVLQGDTIENQDRLNLLREAISNKNIVLNDIEAKVTITIGACNTAAYSNFNTSINIADQKLYDGKSKGKNCVVI